MPEPTITLTLTAAELRVIQRVARFTDYQPHGGLDLYDWLKALPTQHARRWERDRDPPLPSRSLRTRPLPGRLRRGRYLRDLKWPESFDG